MTESAMADNNFDDVAGDLTTHEVAELLGVTQQTVMAWCRRGWGYRVGARAKNWRIPRERLEQIQRARAAAVRA
jgi:excisionase family DNA binding protein